MTQCHQMGCKLVKNAKVIAIKPVVGEVENVVKEETLCQTPVQVWANDLVGGTDYRRKEGRMSTSVFTVQHEHKNAHFLG